MIARDATEQVERVLDRLTDALFDVDDALGMLSEEGAAGMRWMEPALRTIANQIDDAMKRLCD